MRISDWSSDVCSSDLHYRERDVTILVHSRSLVNKSVISILKTHRAVRQIAGRELGIEDTMPILKELSTLDLGPARLDIGQIAVAFEQHSEALATAEFAARGVAVATRQTTTSQQGRRGETRRE